MFLGALRQVSQAAAHANDSMKRIEQFKKLLEVQDSIGGAIDLVSPTRQDQHQCVYDGSPKF